MLSTAVINSLDAEDLPPGIRRYAEAIGVNAFLDLCDQFPGHVVVLPQNLRISIAKRYIQRHLSHDEQDLAVAVGVSVGFVRTVKETTLHGSSFTDNLSPHDAMMIGNACRLVMAHYRITEAELLSSSRQDHIVWPRHVAIFMVRRFCPHLSNRFLAEIFQRSNHTTIISAVKAVEHRIATDQHRRHDLATITDQLLAIRNGIASIPTPTNEPTNQQPTNQTNPTHHANRTDQPPTDPPPPSKRRPVRRARH